MIKFKDLPNTDTPINAENLNNNFEEASIAISPTEPTTKERVWFKKSKNLLPVSAYTGTSNGVTFTVNSDGSISISGTSTARTLFNINNTRPIKLQNGSYVLSKTGDASYVEVYLRKSSPNEIIASIAGTATVKKFTNTYTENVFTYIAIASGVTINTTITLQLEAGTQATEYEPYVEKEIYTKNANGVYEKFGNLEESEINIADLLTNGWAEQFKSYCFKKGDVVTLHLSINQGTAKTILTLPEGYRPPETLQTAILGVGKTAILFIRSSGVVELVNDDLVNYGTSAIYAHISYKVKKQ